MAVQAAAPELGAAGVMLLLALALQFGLQPFLTRGFVSKEVHPTSIVIFGEMTKFILSLLMLTLVDGQLTACLRRWTLRDSVVRAGLPALIYTVQNILLQIAYQNLDGLTFNLVNQTKTIFTVVALYLVMGRRQSMRQCLALAAIFGVSLLMASEKSAASTDGRKNSFESGIVPLVAASMLSGAASAFSQKNLQGRSNSYFFTMELCVYSMVALTITLATTQKGADLWEAGLLRGWELTTMLPVISSSFGGICVGLVIKYAGGVRKGFAIIAGILLTGIVESVVKGSLPSATTTVALPIVMLSTWMHIRYPYQASVPQQDGGRKKRN